MSRVSGTLSHCQVGKTGGVGGTLQELTTVNFTSAGLVVESKVELVVF